MRHPKVTLIAQLIAALTLLVASVTKLVGEPGSIEVFTKLGMEPTGRYLIGFIEFSAAALLLSPFAAIGALLSVGVMCGAIIAHATSLGLVLHDDSGGHACLLLAVLISSSYVLISRRKELPILGETL
jgi:putative oxidoreductase